MEVSFTGSRLARTKLLLAGARLMLLRAVKLVGRRGGGIGERGCAG
jgi:hypothetical protein